MRSYDYRVACCMRCSFVCVHKEGPVSLSTSQVHTGRTFSQPGAISFPQPCTYAIGHSVMSTAVSLICYQIPTTMNRKLHQATLAILLFITALVMYINFFPTYRWQGFNRALKTSNGVCLLEEKENIDVSSSLLTYGSNKDAPEFFCEPSEGVRVLILAYGR